MWIDTGSDTHVTRGMRWARRMKRGSSALGAVLLLAGCFLTRSGDDAVPDTLHAELSARLAETRAAQESALALWERLIDGEPVSCQETVTVPAPLALSDDQRARYPSAAAAAAWLNEAIAQVAASVDLWNIECAAAREAVPLDMARAGRANALAAAAPLEQAAAVLAHWG